MGQALEIEKIKRLDKTSEKILHLIAERMGEQEGVFIDYKEIAELCSIERDTVRKSVNRMIERKILKIQNNKLHIIGAFFVEK